MTLEKNTVVLASAGTGKTRKLVEVYLGLLDSGVDPAGIVAVTFTEKAAAEMRDRIRAAIYDRLAVLPVDDHARWLRILNVLPGAPISTIHGFCGMILREHGLALGINPGFSVLDEQLSLDLARESAVETLQSEIRSGDEGAARLFGDFGLAGLVEILVRAGYWMNSLGKDASWLNERVADQQNAADVISRELADHIARHAGDFEAIGVFADELDAKKTKHAFRKRDDSRAVLPRLGQIAGVETARQLSRLAGLSSGRFRLRKQALNSLDFDDMLLGARDLLARFESIRLNYQSQFRALLVDEFQDTDEVQAAIIELLAQDPSGLHRYTPGKLMIVGDPKQSIYRFRRARVTVFFRMMDAIVKDGGVLEHLQENRRSAPPIAEFANRLSESMLDGLGKETLSGGVDLSYRVRFSASDLLIPKSDAPFLGITYVAADDEVKAAEGRGMEAEAIARLLKNWKFSGTIQKWKEVALLLRATTNMKRYIEALEAHDIPVFVLQGTYFYQKTEVSDLIALLELILHPADPLLRATVLTSSLAGLPFAGLLQEDEVAIESTHLDAILQPWIEMRDRATAAEILESVIRKTGYDVVMMAQRNGPQRVANIGKLIEITRGLARQGTAALDAVVRHLRDRAQDPGVREAEAQIAGEDDDVVRMLTVHQAKGLEFDIVIVPDLAVKTARGTGDRTFFSDKWGILAGASYGLHRKPLPHALILEAKAEDDDQQFEEEKRLLYVAVTRAKKMLVLGEGFSRHGGPWLGWVQALFEQSHTGAIARAREGKPVKARFKTFTIDIVPASMLNVPEQLSLVSDAALVGGESVLARLREMKARVSARTSLPASLELTASELSAQAGCLRYFQWTEILGVAEPGSAPDDALPEMRLGLMAHKAMEFGSAVEPGEGISLAAVFESEEWRSLQAVNPESETPFMMHLQVDGRDCWIRGRLDALVAGDRPRVIDYKYARWRDGIEDRYEVQLTAYCLAVMKSLGVERTTGELWFLKDPLRVVRRVYTAVDCESRLRSLIARYISAIESRTWPMAERAYCDKVECGFRQRCWNTD